VSKITDVKAALASATPDWQLVATLKSDDQHIATFSADADANIALVARENLAAFVALYDAVKARQAAYAATLAALSEAMAALHGAVKAVQSADAAHASALTALES
jgi:hypothetical protein